VHDHGWVRDQAGGLPKTEAAILYAQELHAGQCRSVDGAPFILHPLEVATLLYQTGAPDHVVAAGVLHDVIEKAGADAGVLARRFGRNIAALVQAVSEDAQIRGYARRKAALRRQAAAAGEEALMVLAADKISKVREFELEAETGDCAATPPAQAPARRLAHYRSCLKLLEAHLAHSPLVTQLAIELAPHLERAAAAVLVTTT
jgi:(p)ppGpp synthase/HD superfamily hydrolase